MIIIDNLLSNCGMKDQLTDDSWWDNIEIDERKEKWADCKSTPSNEVEMFCLFVWRNVYKLKTEVAGWEYWANQIVDGGSMPFHTDNDLDYYATPEQEQELVNAGVVKTADVGFIYYCHKTLCYGGYLEIKRDNGEIERIEPKPNRLIIFDPSFQHGVSTVKHGTRRSILSNLWTNKPKKHDY